jgi:hypothetical protein
LARNTHVQVATQQVYNNKHQNAACINSKRPTHIKDVRPVAKKQTAIMQAELYKGRNMKGNFF